MAVGRYQISGITDLKVLTKGTGSTIVQTDLSYAKSAKFSTKTKEITFEGDDTETTVYKSTGLDIEIESDTYDAALLAIVYAKTETTSISGVASRTYHGDVTEGAGASCGILVLCNAKNLVDNTSVVLQITAFVGTLGAVNPPELANQDKAPLKMKFSAIRTDKDIAGTALVGVPSGGAMWACDRMS